jgi:5-methylcytosine-specific restriction endonuclease McrBC regulatory subunit McrC
MMRRRKTAFVSEWQPRERPLLLLTDQGNDRCVSPDIFGVRGRDRSWNAYADNFFAVNRPQFAALEIEAKLVAEPSGIELTLQPGGIVGAIPLRSPDTQKTVGGVVVRPRFGWNDIGILLSTIGWAASPQLLDYPLVPGSAREVPPWVLAGPMIRRFSVLLKELTRGFRFSEEVRQMPRGQILWQRYCTQQITRGAFHQLPCRFPELGPDQLIRSFIRWGMERIRSSLAMYAQIDLIARQLLEASDILLEQLKDAPVRIPDHHTLDQLILGTSIFSTHLKQGIEALGWILDERGLAGQSETDGLSWRLPMYELFERWVECICRNWAREFGGTIITAHGGDARFPIRWERAGTGSLAELAPDMIVQAGDTVYILDAKYKGHFEELDDIRWRELEETLKAEHRHDLHQVLAYASLFDVPRVVAVLVYPMFLGTWRSLAERGHTVTRASFPGRTRQVELALAGIPLQLQPRVGVELLSKQWDTLRTPLD